MPAPATMTTDQDTELPKAYDPTEVEPRWYAFWESKGFFEATSDPDDPRTPYTIMIPPPNVTGVLHMGHACRTTFEDVLTRYHRMLGRNALWLPGTDHAGIATQVVVERQLEREGKTRHDLGRDAFVERVWRWRETSGGTILKQLRIMGASCDWSRERFTMSPELSRAVREAFVRLYDEGLIYRDTRLVNWDVKAQTVLSDLEVETEEGVQGELFEFAYPLEAGGEVVVATTRPETMLGDTALAVHPEDPRYTHLHGTFATHPFVDRRVPIITDGELVDPEFGTGVVKVTPAHDPNDFATGKRHDLAEVNILNLDGTLNDAAGPFAGMDRFVARKAVKKALDDRGLARGAKKHKMTLPRSQRSGTVVEPIISTQWFVKMEPLAAPAIDAVETGRVRILPEEWTKTYFHWMRNIQDWCISRQLWWGHQIPAWFCDGCGEVVVARDTPTRCSSCAGSALTQDPDVLDTWFSSALWPFSTLGWPDDTPDLRKFYPGDDLETGYDILFFWVARMITMGIHFMGDVPFRRVLLAGMVTDERGEKMSKVKGNVIDPLDVIRGASGEALLEKARTAGAKDTKYLAKTYPDGFAPHGADALRMTLLSYSPGTHRIALSMKRVEGYRNFTNKLWNASRFALMHLRPEDAPGPGASAFPEPTLLANRWVLSRLHRVLETARRGIDDYRLDEASGALYHFLWDELCDWFLELSKPALDAGGAAADETRRVLRHVLETALRAFHPMMPFITEEIWQRIPKAADAPESLCIAPYPEPERDGRRDPEADQEMETLQGVIVAARTVRAEHDLPRSQRIPLIIRPATADAGAALEAQRDGLAALCRADVTITEPVGQDEPVPPRTAVSVVSAATVLVPLEGLVDLDKERARLERELHKVDKDLGGVRKKLDNAGFVERAPAEIVAKERDRLANLEAERAKLAEALRAFSP